MNQDMGGRNSRIDIALTMAERAAGPGSLYPGLYIINGGVREMAEDRLCRQHLPQRGPIHADSPINIRMRSVPIQRKAPASLQLAATQDENSNKTRT
jgi:hypothetical protein